MSDLSAIETATIQASRLPELIALAGEESSEKRRLLLRELTNHFFGAAEHNANESALYGAVLAKLSDEMETAVRAELAVRFAGAPNAPSSLIRRLADDELDVAEPVLRGSSVLTDEDLISVLRKRGQGHLRAASARTVVSEAVSDVIVERGDDDTLGALLRNDGARLSRAASETAVERAKANPALHAATVERQSLPADYAENLAYIDELHAAGQLTPQVLIRFLRTNGRTPFLIALSKLSDVDFHTARGIVERKDLDALSVVCKAADMDRAIYLTYAVAVLGSEDNPMGKAAAYGRMYGELTREAALRTLRFWRMRRTAQAA